MNKSLTFKQYRMIDLTVLAVILALTETLICRATNAWFPDQPYTVSVVTAVIAISMMRWSGWSAVHAVLGGVVYALASGGSAEQTVIYAVGNLAVLSVLLLHKWIGKEKIRDNPAITAVYAAAVHTAASLGRFAVSLAFGGKLTAVTAFLASDALSGVFAIVVVLIARKLDGIFEDQKHYLIREEKKREDARPRKTETSYNY